MRPILLAPVLLLLAACSTPISADFVGADEVYEVVNQNALSAGTPSNATRLALHRADLVDTYDDDPYAALEALHRAALKVDRQDRLFALAELSYLTARDEGDRDLYLASAVYAYLFLEGDAQGLRPAPFDVRFRVACDLYNRSLGEAFRRSDDTWLPRGGVFRLPVGQVTVTVPDAKLHVGTQAFDEFRLAGDYRVRGMTARIHRPGLGTSLISGSTGRRTAAPNEISPGVFVPATAFLDVFGNIEQAEAGGLNAVLALHAPGEAVSVDVRGRDVPLESDVTTPLAYTLRESKLWEFELGSFFSPDEVDIENGLATLMPYQPGKIPVVFVHGTASSPARWAEMINELAADPALRERYQAWLFIYKTSAPILMSAATLRQSLRDRVQALDPDGSDPALRRMVVIGHSQGGLLTRLLVTSSGNEFWSNVSDHPFEEFELDDETREPLRSALFFEPEPYVERVVFVATPHRGSFLSQGLVRTVADWFISIPKRTAALTSDIVLKNLRLIKGDALRNSPTAVDNMAPGHPFLQALEAAPMDARVHKHSIVAVTSLDDLEAQDDGVVQYTSAHLEGAESEKVVLSGHSVQGNAACILEVRRILYQHVGLRLSARSGD